MRIYIAKAFIIPQLRALLEHYNITFNVLYCASYVIHYCDFSQVQSARWVNASNQYAFYAVNRSSPRMIITSLWVVLTLFATLSSIHSYPPFCGISYFPMFLVLHPFILYFVISQHVCVSYVSCALYYLQGDCQDRTTLYNSFYLDVTLHTYYSCGHAWSTEYTSLVTT